MARPGPKSKKGKPAPKSKKVEKEPEIVEDEEQVMTEEEDDAQDKNGNNVTEDESEVEPDEPPAKKGRGAKGKATAKKAPAAKKTAKGRKAPVKKAAKEEEEDDEEDEKEYEVQYILNDRTKKGAKEYLVKWKGYSQNQATWEPESNLNCEEAINDYLKKQDEGKKGLAREMREGRKKTERYADVTSGPSGKRHSRRNNKSPRKSYVEEQESD